MKFIADFRSFKKQSLIFNLKIQYYKILVLNWYEKEIMNNEKL